MLDVKLNSKPVKMELDTGAAVCVMRTMGTCITKSNFVQQPNPCKTYTGKSGRPKGVCQVGVTNANFLKKPDILFLLEKS